MCVAISHVRFTPNSDRKSGHAAMVMSALHLKADMCGALSHVCFGPIADMHLIEHPAHSPCSRNQMNGPVTFYRETGTYAVTQCDTPLLGKRHTVARRWCLPAKKWRPVIFKV